MRSSIERLGCSRLRRGFWVFARGIGPFGARAAGRFAFLLWVEGGVSEIEEAHKARARTLHLYAFLAP